MVGDVSFYQLDRPHQFFVEGSGLVTDRDHNRLVLEELSGDEIVLKYHFMKGLQAQPAAELAPIYIGSDPNPFIKILRPPKRLTLSLR